VFSPADHATPLYPQKLALNFAEKEYRLRVFENRVLEGADVSEELSASFIKVTRIGELGTTLAVPSVVPSSPILVILM
jgi:hypothetical protein